MPRMPKKKPTGGQHKTPRKPVQVPVEWLNVARKLANANRQPTLWYFLSLVADAADKAGVERPRLPWEDTEVP